MAAFLQTGACPVISKTRVAASNGLPHARPIDAGLWELRAGAARLFYFAYINRRFIMLHGYRKQSQKAPRQEIETARRRWAAFLEGEQ